ncbi:aminotransferase class V-fold PLP-dependent enzyme [Calycomorphotria hydatis]|uniref:Cysteine desulfurase n=1 Tax=Calycomorphotria hydatis TaxID=2528027 RepID=A0A517T693_9PLAN|nr:aminotransferase class V-fold PLP-dependent enzyme [Calycomorphotria hydatis]QDT63893.1 Cysteine desulfurase [Calycomorphotria hydatis]
MTSEECEQLRWQMPVAERLAYFNHAAVSPLPEPTRAAMVAYINDFADNGSANWLKYRQNVEHVRTLAAEMINASADEVAFIRNTTEGIGLVAEGIDWQPGDNVVVAKSEFPSNLIPWRNLASRGVEVREIGLVDDERIDPADFASACDQRTRLVTSSWVGYLTGYRRDIAAACDVAHQHGAYFFLDAIQGLGVLPLDVSEISIDFLAADGHKWLLGPEGAGVMYVRQQNLDTLRPLMVGWNSVVRPERFDHEERQWKPNAGRYEGGTYNLVGAAGLAASLKLLNDLGVNAVAARLREITDLLTSRLIEVGTEVVSDRSEEHWSGIVSFRVKGVDSNLIQQQAAANDVAVMVRNGNVRAAPHVYTNEQDVERLVRVIEEAQ